MANIEDVRQALGALASDVAHVSPTLTISAEVTQRVHVIGQAIDELAALREWRDAAVPLLRVLAKNGSKALRGHHFDCWYCGEQPFKYFEPGGILEAGWEHAPDCPITSAHALLSQMPENG